MNKQNWHHKMPYPTWPFGIVDPKELAKWGKANTPPAPATEPAPF